MLGTIVNTGTILTGSVIGSVVRKGIIRYCLLSAWQWEVFLVQF